MRRDCPDCKVDLVRDEAYQTRIVRVCPNCGKQFSQRKRQKGKPPAAQRYLNFIRMIASLRGKADWMMTEAGMATLFLQNEGQALPDVTFTDPMEAMKHFKIQ